MDNESKSDDSSSENKSLGITKTEVIHQILSMADSVNTTFDEKKVFTEFKNPIRIKSHLNGKFYFILEIGKIGK